MLAVSPAIGAGWSTSVPLLAGDAGTSQTIDLIRSAVDQGLKDPLVRQTVAQILRGVPAYQDGREVRAIYEWVKRHIRFTKDPVGKETISTARFILTAGIGDCDDINAVLLPTLVGAVGYGSRLVTIASDPRSPQQFSHIYAEVNVRGRWVPLDAARPGASFGVAPSRYFRRRVWPLGNSDDGVAGLAGYHMGFDFSAFSRALPSVTQAATSVISTIRAPKQFLTPGLTFGPGGEATFPAGSAAALPAPRDNTNLLLIGAAIVGGALLLLRKGS